jgi:hypothetical protein
MIMKRIRLWISCLLMSGMVTACDNQDKSKGPPTSTRPAVVTQEMADTFEAYVRAFENLTNDIEKAGADCRAALAAVERDTKDIVALGPRGDKLAESMKATKGDTAAGVWFGTTFGARMKAAAEKLQPLQKNCSAAIDLHAALDNAMSLFPMMRKKG